MVDKRGSGPGATGGKPGGELPAETLAYGEQQGAAEPGERAVSGVEKTIAADPQTDHTLAADASTGQTWAQPAAGGGTSATEGVGGGAGPAGRQPQVSTPQITVLPRIEFEGEAARILHDGKHRYEPGRSLGAGGVGEVLSALDHDIGREVAVKRLRADIQSPVALARFVEEIRTTGRLEHPNIVPIHDVGVDEKGEYYFVMKQVAGETLEDIISKLRAGDADTHRRYGFESRVQLFIGILEAISFAHTQGVVHRDLKPANIMVGAFGEVLVMDWGIAKHLHGTDAADDDATLRLESDGDGGGAASEETRKFQTQLGSLIGTPAYMSPEQASGQPVDERSDIYSLCVILHELLTLEHYLADKTTVAEALLGVLEQPHPVAAFSRHPHQSNVSAELSHFVKKGVRKDPAERYQSVAEMRQRLARRAEGDIPVECAMTAVKSVNYKTMRFLDGHPIIFGLCLLAGLASIIGGGVLVVTQLT